jgi:YHS domain-containing protein
MTTLVILAALLAQKDPGSTKEAMKAVQVLVGEWRVAVDGPEPWEETQSWEYRIDKEVYALQFTVKDGKYAKDGTLGYDLKKKVYRLELTRADGTKAAFEGKLNGKELSLEEQAAEGAAAEKIDLNLLRDIRFLVSVEKRAAGSKIFEPHLRWQAMRQGASIVKVAQPVCVVTGGSAQTAVEYMGKTYYVCCSTCRKEFTADPKKVIEQAKKEGLIK